MTKPITDAAVTTIVENGKSGREAWKRGELGKAEEFFFAAWNVLPEPKTDYDYAQSMSGGFVTFYRDTKQFEKAKKWIDVMRFAYGPEPSEYVDFIAAMVHYDAGEFDSAFAIFDAQFKKYKRRPFEGEDKKYLEFYKKRVAGN